MPERRSQRVGSLNHGCQEREVRQMPIAAPILEVRPGGRFDHQGAGHVGPGDLTHLVCDLNRNQFSPIERLPAAGFQGCAPGRATSTRGRLPNVCRDEDVDLRSVV
jgi:hypothetical protein